MGRTDFISVSAHFYAVQIEKKAQMYYYIRSKSDLICPD